MKMESKSLKKLEKIYKIFSLLWYLVIAAFIILTFAFIISSLNNSININSGLALESMIINIRISGDYISPPSMIALNILILLGLILVAYILYKMKTIIKNTINDTTAFSEVNIKAFRQIAYSLYVFAGFHLLLQLFLIVFTDLDNIFHELNQIQGLEISQNISLYIEPILLGIFLLIIVEIFKHGMQLQEDSESIV
ncbi:MAG: DUF2975 domain-containing protein [bacterium]